MSFFSSLSAEAYDRQYSNKELFRRIFGYFKPHRKRMTVIMIALVLQGAIGALPPLLVSKVLDLSTAGVTNQQVYLRLVFGVVFLELLIYILYYIVHRLMARVIADTTRSMSANAFQAAMQQDMSFYDEFSSGKVLSRITTDTSDFANLVTLTSDVLNNLLQSLLLAFILLRTEWRLAMGLFTLIPVLTVIITQYRKWARWVTQRGMRAMANVNATIKETVSGISVAKNFRQEASIFKDFDRANKDSFRVNIRRGFVLSILFPMTRTLVGAAMALLTYYGAKSVLAAAITAGAWYLFVNSIDRFMQPVMSLTQYVAQVQQGLSAAERIFALIEAPHSVKQNANYVPDSLIGSIYFRHLAFSYPNGTQVLKDFDLHIEPGETVAIVGHTGAGKSSIARLVTRFYEFQGGELLIDGRDIRSYNLQALRKHMGIVTQVPFLFEGSVEENIRFSKPEITRQEILALAEDVGQGEWLETLANGLETNVGERGAQISMGQRQLVALMRVLAHAPSIFILDEATASIDPFTEKQIQMALELILKQSTSILIAHRLSTIQSADRIIVLDHGLIKEEGTHKSLLAKAGHYAELYNTYFRHQSLDYVEQSGKMFES
ncbi:MAG: ABC transporter ATP-binding protein [Anaerolineaceae bacterium]|nr:ABC transporter ATP-binding protein [Anaerolineaceae bacterium]